MNVLESSLDVPNVFTLMVMAKTMGFRVAYKSILTFSGTVYNLLGSLGIQLDRSQRMGWKHQLETKRPETLFLFYRGNRSG